MSIPSSPCCCCCSASCNTILLLVKETTFLPNQVMHPLLHAGDNLLGSDEDISDPSEGISSGACPTEHHVLPGYLEAACSSSSVWPSLAVHHKQVLLVGGMRLLTLSTFWDAATRPDTSNGCSLQQMQMRQAVRQKLMMSSICQKITSMVQMMRRQPQVCLVPDEHMTMLRARLCIVHYAPN